MTRSLVSELFDIDKALGDELNQSYFVQMFPTAVACGVAFGVAASAVGSVPVIDLNGPQLAAVAPDHGATMSPLTPPTPAGMSA